MNEADELMSGHYTLHFSVRTSPRLTAVASLSETCPACTCTVALSPIMLAETQLRQPPRHQRTGYCVMLLPVSSCYSQQSHRIY